MLGLMDLINSNPLGWRQHPIGWPSPNAGAFHGCWGLLGLSLIIMDHETLFPTFSTSKNDIGWLLGGLRYFCWGWWSHFLRLFQRVLAIEMGNLHRTWDGKNGSCFNTLSFSIFFMPKTISAQGTSHVCVCTRTLETVSNGWLLPRALLLVGSG